MKKILIIDDEPDFCFFVKENLELTGAYAVLIAHGGAEGLAVAFKERPDLILLDLLMPNIDGATVYKELEAHEATAAIPVIILTAISAEAVRERISELPAEAFLTKPVQFGDLKARIVAMLTGR